MKSRFTRFGVALTLATLLSSGLVLAEPPFSPPPPEAEERVCDLREALFGLPPVGKPATVLFVVFGCASGEGG